MYKFFSRIVIGLWSVSLILAHAAENAAPALENGFLNPPVTVQTATEIEIKP